MVSRVLRRLKISPSFPHVKTEEGRPAKNVKIKSEDCILNAKILKSTVAAWLDPNIQMQAAVLSLCELTELEFSA